MNNKNISKVYLLSVPLENDYKNTLYFTNKDNQHSYFASKIVKSYDNFSYQRKDHVIRIPEEYDKIYHCNYVMYQNTAYSNKWFYCFIKEMKFISEGVTELIIETDVIQTWLFDYTIKPSFVEREHVIDDSIGLHTVPEGLETGEYICNEVVKDDELEDLSYVIMVSEWTGGSENKPLAVNYGGIFSAGGAYICETMSQVVNIIQAYQDGRGDAVIGVYMVPTKIIKEDEPDDTLQFQGQSKPVTYITAFDKQTKLNGYTPRNNKLLTYPYQYIINSNNNGNANILQYEYFSGNGCTFEIEGVPTIGGSIKCVPMNYKGIERMQEEGIMLGKFPTLSWSEDLYTNWLTQNAVNIGIGIASSGLSIIGGLGMMGTGAGAVAGGSMLLSGGMGIAQTIGQVYQHEMIPNSAKGNINGGDITTSHKMNLFHFYKMSITKEYAEIIDKYFDIRGYKVNMVKTPNKAHRSRYWYTKTIDINIDGDIPMNDMQKIKDCYNRGITFWRNASEIQNYDLTNEIV